MPEEFSGYDEHEAEEESENPRLVTVQRDQIRVIEDKAKRADAAEAEAAALKKENIFLKAGVDTSSAIGKLLFDGYNGELTAEAVASRAEEVGALKPATPPEPEPSEGPALEEGEESSTGERRLLETGSEPPTGQAPVKTGKETALEVATQAKKSGATEEETLGAYFSQIAQAAEKGDKSVLVQLPE